MKPWLSIVIPCWNCEKTIKRLLDSILECGLKKEELQIIICNDNSTDNFLEIVKLFEIKLDITYCKTVTKIHCPGNTRQTALSLVRGRWFCFIDNDDAFEYKSLLYVKEYIEKNNIKYTLCTNIREWDDEKKLYLREIKGEETDTWLHGKFFNTENTLHMFNCHFKKDLFSHEDVYFNSENLGHLIGNGLDYEYLDFFTYKWIYRPDSLSRSYFNKKYYYIDNYLSDFICAASEPFFNFIKIYPKYKDWYINQIMMTLLHSYFYYQSNIWRNGSNILTKNTNCIHDLKIKVMKEFNWNEFDIINYIYSIPKRYNSIKQKCIKGSCNFIESQSFRDFIINI